jgi:hypothetical protein
VKETALSPNLNPDWGQEALGACSTATEALIEAVDTTCRVDGFLFTRVKRMALRTYFD